MNTQALILAAGRGSRMRDLTDDKPKCLVRLAGKPLLEWQLQSIRRAGVETITVARGYKAEMLQGEFRTVDNPRWEETNMVSTLLSALPALDHGPCIVSYSDIVYHPGHVGALADCDADIAVLYDTDWRALWESRFDNPLADAETFKEQNGILKEIGNRTDSYEDIQGQFMGLLRFSPTGFATVRGYLGTLPGGEVDKLDMTALLQRLLREGVTIAAVAVSGKWCETDSVADLELYEQMALKQETDRWSHDWRE